MFGISILAHEFGHSIVLEHRIKRRYEYSISWSHIGLIADLRDVPKIDLMWMYGTGIIFGLFPIWAFCSMYNLVWWAELPIFGLYLWGCKSDWLQIWRLLDVSKEKEV
jgi:hypothetical protein